MFSYTGRIGLWITRCIKIYGFMPILMAGVKFWVLVGINIKRLSGAAVIQIFTGDVRGLYKG
jgi:hypothetical protein